MKYAKDFNQGSDQAPGRLKWLVVALAAASAGYLPHAGAQQPGAGAQPQQQGARSVGVLEEVVVTARRRQELQQDIPVAVTALSSEELTNQNVGELADLRTSVPSLGVSSGSGGTTNAPLVSLRGQRPSEVLLTLDPAIPLYFADVAVTPTYGTNLAMYDLENVQVLKGPQGTLFGRNSTGGAMLFTPRRPGEEFGGYAKATIGNYGLYQFEGGVDIPVNDDLAFRVAGRSVDRDGYQDNVADNALAGDEKYWDEDSMGLRVTMDLDLGAFRNQATVSYDENDMQSRIPVPQTFNPAVGAGQLWGLIHNGGLARQFPEPIRSAVGLGDLADPELDQALARADGRDPHEIETDLDAREEVENWFFANTTEFDLTDDLTLKNIFGYRKLDYQAVNDADGTALPLFGAITSADQPVTRESPRRDIDSEQFSNEIQLVGYALDGRLEWIAGGYWYLMDGEERLPNQVSGANPDWPQGQAPAPQLAAPWAIAQMGLVQSSPNADVENESYALFAEGTYDFSDQWAVTLGLRQTWDERSIEASNKQGVGVPLCMMQDRQGNPLPADNCVRKEEEKFDSPTGRVALEFSPRQGMLYYGSVSTGYRAGGFNARGVSNATLRPFDEETVTTFELGHKADWEIGGLSNLRTNLAIYQQDYEDIQKTQAVDDPDAGFITTTINAAEATIRGAELDVLMAPTNNLSVKLAYSWVDAEYDDWTLGTGAPNNPIRDNSDGLFTYIPEHSLNGSVNYMLPLDPSLGDISLIASVYWQDEMATHAEAHRFGDSSLPPALATQFDFEGAEDVAFADDYAVWNLRINWDRFLESDVDLAAFVNNLTDEEYVTGGLNVPDSLGFASATYGAPRTYGASVQWNF